MPFSTVPTLIVFRICSQLLSMNTAPSNYPTCHLFPLSVCYSLHYNQGFPGVSVAKNPPAKQETQVWPLGWEDPWRMKWQPSPVFLLGKSHGQRSLAGYSLWNHKELDTAYDKTTTLSLLCQFGLRPWAGVSSRCTLTVMYSINNIYWAPTKCQRIAGSIQAWSLPLEVNR